jgi:AraC-like DNA-binding protein
VPQYKLIRNWLFIFALIITIITINFTVAMANMWMYDDKSIFLQKASGALLFASVVYVGMNMIVMLFPHIMYGLPIEIKESMYVPLVNEMPVSEIPVMDEIKEDETALHDELEIKKEIPTLFSPDYIEKILHVLQEIIEQEKYLEPEFKLMTIASQSGLPAHHLTYYFNTILNLSFTEWRNKLRIDYTINLLDKGHSSHLTLEAISVKSGFTAQNTFIRAFKLYTGQTPSEYMKKRG